MGNLVLQIGVADQKAKPEWHILTTLLFINGLIWIIAVCKKKKNTLCVFVVFFFSPFSIAITSLGEERANLSAFCTFARFALVWFCLFPLPLRVWDGLQLVILALPGLFSLLFLQTKLKGVKQLSPVILLLWQVHPTELVYKVTGKSHSHRTKPTNDTKSKQTNTDTTLATNQRQANQPTPSSQSRWSPF